MRICGFNRCLGPSRHHSVFDTQQVCKQAHLLEVTQSLGDVYLAHTHATIVLPLAP